MQVAKVLALFKKGNRASVSNYRPILVLPIFSKALEKIIFNRLSNFLEKNSMLSNCQYAFRKRRSTHLALLEQKEFILKNIKKRQLTLGVSIDYSKAFYSINHKLLLEKMRYYGIRGIALELITSYLGHSSQFVQVNNLRSKIRQLHLGVPQGSILGPLLFNMYIIDIVNVDTNTKYIIYADDVTLLVSSCSWYKPRMKCLKKYTDGQRTTA